jgi:hypothetical protein
VHLFVFWCILVPERDRNGPKGLKRGRNGNFLPPDTLPGP